MNWPTISAGVRLRTSGCVPVWQKLQVSVQPTWLDTQTEPRSSSGMLTVSASLPSGKRSSHLRVPSIERCSVTICGPLDHELLGQPIARLLGDVGHPPEVGDAVPVDPLPDLGGAERLQPGLGQRRLQPVARQADQVAAQIVAAVRGSAGLENLQRFGGQNGHWSA